MIINETKSMSLIQTRSKHRIISMYGDQEFRKKDLIRIIIYNI